MLVIEGDEDAKAALVYALRESGYAVEACGEAVPGFRKACAMLPDCIVLNPQLPDIDGVWIARKIRTETGPIAKVPLLFVGDGTDASMRIRTLNVGADVFIARPTPTEDIVAQIAALIGMARRLDAGKADSEPMSMSVGAAIRGDLGEFPIASLLMMFEMERRSGIVEVACESGKRASLTLTSGLFSSTELAGQGRPALEVLRAVLSWQAGRFSFHARDSNSLPAPRASIAALVLEAVRLDDEARNPDVAELDAEDLIEADSLRGANEVNDTERPPGELPGPPDVF